MRSITKLDLQYAHRFYGFKGEAQYLHGHTGVLTIEVEDSVEPGVNMVFPCNEIQKTAWEVLKNFDHALILSDYAYHNKAESALLWWVKQFQMKFLILPQRTTAEHMAAYMCTLVRDAYLGWGVPEKCIPEIGVRLWETPTSYVEVFL